MYAIFTARKLMLTSRINQINLKLMQISQKQQDLAAYSSNIADGMITPEEAANSPASLFQRQNAYMNTTVSNAWNQSNAATQQYLAQYNAMNGGTNGQVSKTIDPTGTTSNVNQSMLQSAYFQQAMKAAAQNESKKVSALDNELDEQRLSLETQLKAAQAELENVEKAEDNGIKQSAPKYSGAS